MLADMVKAKEDDPTSPLKSPPSSGDSVGHRMPTLLDLFSSQFDLNSPSELSYLLVLDS